MNSLDKEFIFLGEILINGEDKDQYNEAWNPRRETRIRDPTILDVKGCPEQ